MAKADEDVFGAPPKKKTVHEIGEPLDTFSADELTERIGLLRAEIERLEAARTAKEASRAAAAAFFKS
ncbi:MAG: DUF1192 domain-containing protein [Beijerinckiaceae bacterium]|nr:DUF1192 domain-containing protein [Beijerinckiaceae bacterium]